MNGFSIVNAGEVSVPFVSSPLKNVLTRNRPL